MGFSDFWINNNGKKEHLNNAKHGVRKEQVDEKFHNLFDAYDANGDGTLEDEELKGIFTGLTKFAGADKTLDAVENIQVASLFANQAGIQDADFMGFVRSVSKATEDILESKTTQTLDGGREVTTTYKDGTVETISYYPDGEYKFKKQDKKGSNTSYYLVGNNEKQFTAQEIENQIKANYNEYLSNFKPAENKKPVSYQEFKANSMNRYNIRKINSDFEQHNLYLSERAKADMEVRDFVLNHYIETHKAAQEALESMGILDDVGAAINAGASELWNSIKNVWNGTEEEYQNFYELSKKFEPNYNKALRTGGSLDVMRNNPEMFFRSFETDFKKDMGHQFDLENSAQFQQTTEQYQNAQILKQRMDILDKALFEIKLYNNLKPSFGYDYASADNPSTEPPESHIQKANKFLLEYFDGDQDAVNLILNGTLDNAETTIKAIMGIKEETETQMKSILGERSFEDIQNDYKSQYKAMYGTDFVPDELTEKVMDAKATGGMVKLAAITIVSILVTKSPIFAEISGAAAGSAEATGMAANAVRQLLSYATKKLGSEAAARIAVQQGIKFAMTSGTLATDVGLTLLNQATSERGVNGEELLEEAKGSAKYIFFGAYVGAPLAQAVSKSLGKIGATAKLFEGGVKAGEGAIQTTSITGDKLLQNFMKGGNTVLAKGGAFLTEFGTFAGLDVTTEDVNITDALAQQGSFLPKLKVMNQVLEYILGAKVHTATSRANLDAAIEKSGVKNWNIKEIKTPQKTQYIVDIDGLPVGRFDDANQLATAMLERVSANYSENAGTQTRTETTKPEAEAKTEWIKRDINGEEVEFAVVTNPDGTRSVDFNRARKLNAHGEYEEFNVKLENDLLSSEAEVNPEQDNNKKAPRGIALSSAETPKGQGIDAEKILEVYDETGNLVSKDKYSVDGKLLEREFPDESYEVYQYDDEGILSSVTLKMGRGDYIAEIKKTRYLKDGRNFVQFDVLAMPNENPYEITATDQQRIEQLQQTGKSLIEAVFETKCKAISDIDKIQANRLLNNLDNMLAETFDVAQFTKFIDEHHNINLQKLNEYVEKLDFQKICEIAPDLKKAKTENIMEFLYYHARNNTTTFDQNTLALSEDLTTYLSKNYVDANEMEKLLTIFPCTSRNVGSLPDGWAAENNSSLSAEVYNAIEVFRTKASLKKEGVSNEELVEFQNSLSMLLNKDVKIKFIGSGCYGSGYKISVPGADDLVLKIFHEVPDMYVSEKHGKFIEPQTAVFLNSNSNAFAKFYFGRIGIESHPDGFIVCKFVSGENTEKWLDSNLSNNTEVLIYASDVGDNQNRIGNTIIESGGIYIRYKRDIKD